MSSQVPRIHDVAIAGAGLAGASLALRLGRAGLDVALLDAGTFPRDKLCGEFFSPECWGVLDRLGIAPDLAALDYRPIRRVRVTTPNGRSIDAEFAPDGTPPGIGLSRATIDDHLVHAARAAGVTVMEATRAGGPIVVDGRVVGIAARGPGHERVEVQARVVVAADGRHSKLVESTGRVRVRSLARPDLFGLKRHFDVPPGASGEPDDAVGLHLVAGGYAGTCRVDGGRVNLCALLPSAMARAARGDLDRVAADALSRNPALARLADASTPAGPWKTVAGVKVQHATPTLPGILFAGDAMGTVDPLGGQGMTMALLGAELLDPFVRHAVSGGVADSPLQQTYRSTWHRRFTRRITLCRAFHHTLTHPGLLDLASRSPRLAAQTLARCFALTRDRADRVYA